MFLRSTRARLSSPLHTSVNTRSISCFKMSSVSSTKLKDRGKRGGKKQLVVMIKHELKGRCWNKESSPDALTGMGTSFVFIAVSRITIKLLGWLCTNKHNLRIQFTVSEIIRLMWVTFIVKFQHHDFINKFRATHHSSSTTRTSTKNVFLLTRFLKVSGLWQNLVYVLHGQGQ